MTYVGQQPATTFDSGIQDRFTGLTTNTVTLNHEISAEEDILVVWNNIVQDKNTYSVGGTGNKTLTLGGTLVSADVVTVYYLIKEMQSVNPTAGSVGLEQLSATGTASSSNFLRGDNAWATPSDNGKILQVVQNTTTTTTTLTDTTTLTLVTDLNVAITPSATSSKILVMMSCGGMIKGVTNAMRLDMLRDTTTVVSRNRQAYYSGGATDWIPMPFHLNYLDSPSTTSATTYTFKVSMGASSSTGTQINPSGGTASGSVIAMEVGA